MIVTSVVGAGLIVMALIFAYTLRNVQSYRKTLVGFAPTELFGLSLLLNPLRSVSFWLFVCAFVAGICKIIAIGRRRRVHR